MRLRIESVRARLTTFYVVVLAVAIAIPRPAEPCGGGGGSAGTITYRWILSDRIGSGLVELNETGTQTREVSVRGRDTRELRGQDLLRTSR